MAHSLAWWTGLPLGGAYYESREAAFGLVAEDNTLECEQSE